MTKTKTKPKFGDFKIPRGVKLSADSMLPEFPPKAPLPDDLENPSQPYRPRYRAEKRKENNG